MEFRFFQKFSDVRAFTNHPGIFDQYQTGTTIFFMLDYRFSLFLLMSDLHHVLPSSSLAESSAPLQFPDCITCYPPVPRLYHDITCSPPVPRLYHVLPSSSQTVIDRDMISGLTGTGTGTKNPELTGTGTGTGIINQHLTGTGTGTGMKNVT